MNKCLLFTLSILFASSVLAVKLEINGSAIFAQNPEQNLLIYFTPKNKTVHAIDQDRWVIDFSKKGSNGGGRYDFLIKFYSATTRTLSNSGQAHMACFMGKADEIVQTFFDSQLKTIHFDKVNAVASEDKKTIGITLILDQKTKKMMSKPYLHFRLHHCLEAGKSQTFNFENVTVVKNFKSSRLPAQEKAAGKTNLEIGQLTGYEILDRPAENEKVAAKSLPTFELRQDLENIKIKDTDRPWKGLNLSLPKDRESFARVTLLHFFKGMVNQNSNPDFNFIVGKNKESDWCHMPWLQVGDSGREFVHGLTKERDLESSTMYPVLDAGSNWGIGYYNSFGCKTIEKVFGSGKNLKAIPEFYEHKFENGTMSAKILFTTSKTKYLDGSFTFMAHVSSPGSTFRSLQPVRMIQIDIAVKDKDIQGTSPVLDNWVMTTYYFDPQFKWDFAKQFPNAKMAGLMKMRPIGVHSGLDDRTSYIFSGSQTNSVNHPYWDSGKLLNGPADNQKSSCMGCHATAGGSYSGQYKMVPGIKDESMYMEFKRGKNTDFSQQLSFAKRNFDTQPKLDKLDK